MKLEILLVITLYLVMMILIGLICSKKNESIRDFYLGGRKLGPLVTAMSAEASDMSSWLLMGLPGVAYLSGIADAAWTAIGLAIGTYLNWLLVAKRLRRYSERLNNAITIPEFFSNRFHDSSKVLLAVSAILILVFFVPYTASGFAACGKLFSTLFDIPYLLAMLISAVIIVFYTSLGGFWAASTTDLIQSIIMSIALLLVVLFGVRQAGGMDTVIENAQGLSGYLSMIHTHTATGSASYGALSIVSTLAWGLGYFGMPHILLRFMGIRNENELTVSRRIGTVWVVISMAAAIFIGIVGSAVSAAGAIASLQTSSDAETLIIRLSQLLSTHGAIAVFFAGVILAGILASTMSTSDSQLLAASSALSKNLLCDCLGIKLSSKASMLVARGTVIGIALLAAVLAKDPESSVFMIISFAWAGFGAAFGPLMLFSLFWKRTNRFGALAGMLAGSVTVFLWKYLVRPLGGVFDIYELLPAFLMASLAIVVISLLTPAPDSSILEEFDSVLR